jgi:hypothetical protein
MNCEPPLIQQNCPATGLDILILENILNMSCYYLLVDLANFRCISKSVL